MSEPQCQHNPPSTFFSYKMRDLPTPSLAVPPPPGSLSNSSHLYNITKEMGIAIVSTVTVPTMVKQSSFTPDQNVFLIRSKTSSLCKFSMTIFTNISQNPTPSRRTTLLPPPKQKSLESLPPLAAHAMTPIYSLLP
jgi:hypothetical protein